MVVGQWFAIRCPYCNKTFEQEFGITTYYHYKPNGKEVVIFDHGCGEFISEVSSESFWNISRKYNFSGIPPRLRGDIFGIVYGNLSKINDDMDMYNLVVEELKTKYEEAEFNFTALKLYVEVIMSFATMPLFALPLTDEVKKELKQSKTTQMCF